MTSNVQRGSATIYQFPARGRYAQGARADDTAIRHNEEAGTARVAASSGWYHDAAIDAERVTRQ